MVIDLRPALRFAARALRAVALRIDPTAEVSGGGQFDRPPERRGEPRKSADRGQPRPQLADALVARYGSIQAAAAAVHTSPKVITRWRRGQPMLPSSEAKVRAALEAAPADAPAEQANDEESAEEG
jgi:hypothetical protein